MTLTPGATAGVRPPTDLPIAVQSWLQRSCSWPLIGSTKLPKNPSGSVSLFSVSLFSSLLPCSGSSPGLSKTIHFCHVAKSSWHPFSMLIRGQLWIFKIVPGASERQHQRNEDDRHWGVRGLGWGGGSGGKTGKKTKRKIKGVNDWAKSKNIENKQHLVNWDSLVDIEDSGHDDRDDDLSEMSEL